MSWATERSSTVSSWTSTNQYCLSRDMLSNITAADEFLKGCRPTGCILILPTNLDASLDECGDIRPSGTLESLIISPAKAR